MLIILTIFIFYSLLKQGHDKFLKMLSSHSANCHIRSAQSRCSLDLISSNFVRTREELRRSFLSVEPRLRTLILLPEDNLEVPHTGMSQKERDSSDRLNEIMKVFKDLNHVSSLICDIICGLIHTSYHSLSCRIVFPPIYLSPSASLPLSISLSLSLSLSFSLSLSLSLYLCLSLSFSLFLSISSFASLHLSLYLYIYLSIYLSLSLSHSLTLALSFFLSLTLSLSLSLSFSLFSSVYLLFFLHSSRLRR